MNDWFGPVKGLIDVNYIATTVRLLTFGLGRVGLAFATLAAYHGVRNIRGIDPDWVSPRNYASGFAESEVGVSKVQGTENRLRQISSRILFKGLAMDLAPGSERTGILKDWINWATHFGLFFDDFDTASYLAAVLYDRAPCCTALLTERGRTGLAAFSIPGETPCLSCTAGFPRMRQAHGGQTMLVDVLGTVTTAVNQFLGLCLREPRKGFALFAPFVDPHYCLALTINRPGGYRQVVPHRPDIPAGVQLVEVVDRQGGGPSCRTCQGYRC
jgi:hypothetical protein